MTLRSIILGAALALASLASAAARAPAAVPYRWTNVTVGGGGFAPGIVFSPAERGLAYLRTDMAFAFCPRYLSNDISLVYSIFICGDCRRCKRALGCGSLSERSSGGKYGT